MDLKSSKTNSTEYLALDSLLDDDFNLSLSLSKDELKTAKLCRICLREGNINMFIHEYQENEKINDKIMDLTNVEIKEEDDFPKYLCIDCNKMLYVAYMFRIKCQRVDKFLKELETKYELENDNIDSITIEELVPTRKKVCKKRKYKQKTQEKFDNEDNPKQLQEFIDGMFICYRCDVRFDTKLELIEHRRTKSHQNKQIACNTCGTLVSARYLKSHIVQVHTNERPFVCEVCGKGFAKLNTLRRHVAIHTSDLPYKCELCPYRGRFNESVRIHMLTHTGERPFKCSECPMRFARKSNLSAHKRTHNKQHQFQCDVCGKGFHRKSYLEDHIIMIHSGVREHSCNLCGKMFGMRKSMIKHQHKVHKTMPGVKGRVPLYVTLERDSIYKEGDPVLTNQIVSEVLQTSEY